MVEESRSMKSRDDVLIVKQDEDAISKQEVLTVMTVVSTTVSMPPQAEA